MTFVGIYHFFVRWFFPIALICAIFAYFIHKVYELQNPPPPPIFDEKQRTIVAEAITEKLPKHLRYLIAQYAVATEFIKIASNCYRSDLKFTKLCIQFLIQPLSGISYGSTELV